VSYPRWTGTDGAFNYTPILRNAALGHPQGQLAADDGAAQPGHQFVNKPEDPADRCWPRHCAAGHAGPCGWAAAGGATNWPALSYVLDELQGSAIPVVAEETATPYKDFTI